MATTPKLFWQSVVKLESQDPIFPNAVEVKSLYYHNSGKANRKDNFYTFSEWVSPDSQLLSKFKLRTMRFSEEQIREIFQKLSATKF